jgi:hypothetical protein
MFDFRHPDVLNIYKKQELRLTHRIFILWNGYMFRPILGHHQAYFLDNRLLKCLSHYWDPNIAHNVN